MKPIETPDIETPDEVGMKRAILWLKELYRYAELGRAVQDTYGIRTAEEWAEWVRLYGTPTFRP